MERPANISICVDLRARNEKATAQRRATTCPTEAQERKAQGEKTHKGKKHFQHLRNHHHRVLAREAVLAGEWNRD